MTRAARVAGTDAGMVIGSIREIGPTIRELRQKQGQSVRDLSGKTASR